MHLWNSHEMVAAQLHDTAFKLNRSQQTGKAGCLSLLVNHRPSLHM